MAYPPLFALTLRPVPIFRLSALTIGGLLILPTLCLGATPTPAPVTAVTLYPGGATVVRTVTVTPGMTEVLITGLPTGFGLETLAAEADPGIQVGEVKSEDRAQAKAANPQLAQLEARQLALQDQKESLEGEARAARLVLGVMERLGGGNGSGGPTLTLDGKGLASLLGTLGSEATKAQATLQRVAVAQREISNQLRVVEQEMAKLNQERQRATRSLSIRLLAQQPGKLRLTYPVTNAGWKPSYRASLNTEAGVLGIDRRAVIAQKTGEDWQQVRLTLSTTAPRQASRGSEPNPWLLSYQPPQLSNYPSEARMAPMAAKAASPIAASLTAGEPAFQPPTFQSNSLYASEFQVPLPVSLPSDGTELAVELARVELPVRQYLQTSPRQEAVAYVMVDAERPEGEWPEGPLQLIRDGSQVGNLYSWNPSATERLSLGFGRDNQVLVTVTPDKDDTATSGVFEKRRHRHLAHTLAITNRHNRLVDITVLDASPVTVSDTVRVTSRHEPKPDVEGWHDKRGVLAWELKLPAKASTRIRADYDIDYPAEGQLQEQR